MIMILLFLLLPLILSIIGFVIKKRVFYYISLSLAFVFELVSFISETVSKEEPAISFFMFLTYSTVYLILWLIELCLLRKEAVATGILCFVTTIMGYIFFSMADDPNHRVGSYFLVTVILITSILMALVNYMVFKTKKDSIGKSVTQIRNKKYEVESIDEIIS
ncbi:MAG: hypothetical protein K6D96_02660 [Acetatifactor sp.]|nr:hypothetical protein [Acetatifactor sp.]